MERVKAREHLIKRTIESVKGAKNVILWELHLERVKAFLVSKFRGILVLITLESQTLVVPARYLYIQIVICIYR